MSGRRGVSGWSWPRKRKQEKSERRMRVKGRAYSRRQMKRRLRGWESKKRDREEGDYGDAHTR